MTCDEWLDEWDAAARDTAGANSTAAVIVQLGRSATPSVDW